MPTLKWLRAVALVAVCVLALLLLLRHPGLDVSKPVFSCVSVEPAEVLNRNGAAVARYILRQ